MSERSDPFDPGFTEGNHLLDQLREITEDLERRVTDCDIDLYYRAAWTVHVTQSDGEPSYRETEGHDEGLAVSVRRRADDADGFAACSGLSPSAARHALAQALDDLTVSGRPQTSVPIVLPADGGLSDHDLLPALPSAAALTGWLDRATQLVNQLSPRRSGESIESWVEATRTIELWHGTRGITAARGRSRAWAMLRTRPADHSTGTPRPLMTASRSWEGLNESAWSGLLADRWRGTARRSSRVGELGRVAVLIAPEAAAILVATLVRACHGSLDHIGRRVGPGWSVSDRPRDDGALFGGTFDDCGFPTANLELADGSRLLSVIDGAGHQRRASFRDRPAPRYSHLVVSAPEGSVPSRCLIVTGLSIHPLTVREWAIEFDGGLISDGGVAGAVRGFLHDSPATLVERCVGGIGPAQSNQHGVITPALLFDGLQAVLD